MIKPEMFRWLETLSDFKKFRDAISLTDRTMQERYDMELVLRFLLLSRAKSKALQNIRDIDAFITKGMRELASDKTFDFNTEEKIFRKTFVSLVDTLGPDCFVRPGGGPGRGGFLISVFEVVAAGLGSRIRAKVDKPISPTKLKAAYRSLKDNKTFRDYSRSGRSASSRIPQLVPLGRNLFKGV